jgi:hypothetical protein
MGKRIVVFGVIILLGMQLIYAQRNGKVIGVVSDRETMNPSRGALFPTRRGFSAWVT